VWLVCSYYTPDYQKYTTRLTESMRKFGIPNDVQLVNDLGSWDKNTQYKPVFLQQMLSKHKPHSIAYVDIDAEFLCFPTLFNELDNSSDVNIAVHFLDHSKYQRKNHPPELLSGTIFLKNTEEVCIILNEWTQEIERDPAVWDQRALDRVLKKHKYSFLLEEYVVIHDYMSNVKNPVIVHHQASREFRNKGKFKRIQVRKV